MGKFNAKNPSNKTVNLAGGNAFTLDPESELVHAVLTTFLEDKHYESGSDRTTRIAALVARVKPEFVANLAVMARTQFNMRSVVTVLIGELAKTHKGDDLVMRTIVSAAKRPDDLTELVSYLGKPLPKQVKRGIRRALLGFSRYQLAKYRAEDKEISLVDLFNLAHPKAEFASEEQKGAWKDLIEGNLASFDTWEVEISKATSEEERTAAWEKLVTEDKLGYMALIRNLNNLIKYKVSDTVMNLALSRISDRERVKNSKQLPFRFMEAYRNVEGERYIKDAIVRAADISLENMPEFMGTTLIAVDTSGSMMGDRSGKSPIRIASMFAASLIKASPKSRCVLFDTQLRELQISGLMPTIGIAETIIQNATGGGTDTSLVFQAARALYGQGVSFERIFILSDNESWASNVQVFYEEFKLETKTDPFVYAIDLTGYGTKDVKGSKVKHIAGWSDQLLRYVALSEDGISLVDSVRNFSF